VPLRGHRFAVEGTEGLQQVVVDDVGLELLLDFVSRAESARVPKIEIDLDEGRVYLESQRASQYHLLHASMYAEVELMRKEELGRYGNLVHPDEDHATETSQYRPYGNKAKSRVLWVNAVLEHELVEGGTSVQKPSKTKDFWEGLY